MTYFAPYVDNTGLHIPTYIDIRDNLILQFKSIYGQDIYLENDSQDYQMISAFASAINDSNQALVLAYNNVSPTFAIGAGLDRVVALNGISRKASSYSTAVVTLTGTAGTLITDGVVSDVNGVYWSLPSSVTITQSGTVDSTVTCQVAGAITANALEINKIVTPTYGWLSVVNNAVAIPGQSIETDTQLRIRQQQSVANPSQTIFAGTIGAVSAVIGVTRVKGYENDTGSTVNSLLAHSIAIVAEGGINVDIANAIYLHKSLGCYTNGTTTVNVPLLDGSTMPIRFYRPTYKDIQVQVTVTKLTGYTSALKDIIKANILSYINGLNIGESVYVPNLYQPIYATLPDSKNPAFACTALTANIVGSSAASPLVIGQLEVAKITLDNITVTEV